MKSDPWKTSSALGLVPTRNHPKKIGTLLDLQRSIVSSSLDFSIIGLLQQIELHMMLIPLLEEKFIAQLLFLKDYRQIISWKCFFHPIPCVITLCQNITSEEHLRINNYNA
ncbi:hypothetical protein AABB24_025801 [Solanum stoloniferum]|uniref:Uncharacterized protein n=1 Tax=Solanum stoloniferum TaxID=62892 RepID=A0ABD2SBE4_9SOLN